MMKERDLEEGTPMELRQGDGGGLGRKPAAYYYRCALLILSGEYSCLSIIGLLSLDLFYSSAPFWPPAAAGNR
jgi:hypothetical protein